MAARAKPMTAKFSESRPPLARLYSAGISLRLVRSPPAPKITMTQGGAGWASPGLCASADAILVSPFSGPRPARRSHCLCRCAAGVLTAGRFFHVPAELLPHRGEDLLREGVLLARAETRVQRLGEHRGGHRLLNGRH